jgi:hypothetical protein
MSQRQLKKKEDKHNGQDKHNDLWGFFVSHVHHHITKPWDELKKGIVQHLSSPYDRKSKHTITDSAEEIIAALKRMDLSSGDKKSQMNVVKQADSMLLALESKIDNLDPFGRKNPWINYELATKERPNQEQQKHLMQLVQRLCAQRNTVAHHGLNVLCIQPWQNYDMAMQFKQAKKRHAAAELAETKADNNPPKFVVYK